MLYTNSIEEQYGFIQKAKDRGYDVLHIDGPLAPHWIANAEQAIENVMFARVDSDSMDKLIQKEEEIPSKLSKEDEEVLKPIFESVVNEEKYKVQFESMSADDAPIIITQPEFIRRMMEQQKMGGAGFLGAFPDTFNVLVNSNHAKIGDVLSAKTVKTKTKKVKQLTDIALLSQGMLKGEDLNKFIERSIELV
jgi:molecular chaperone HtpG